MWDMGSFRTNARQQNSNWISFWPDIFYILASTLKWKVATFDRIIRQLSNQLIDNLNLIAGRSKSIARIGFSLHSFQVQQRSIMYFDSYRIQYTPSMSKIIFSTWLAYQVAPSNKRKGCNNLYAKNDVAFYCNVFFGGELWNFFCHSLLLSLDDC